MDPALFPDETLHEFYRFALLLTGDPAAAENLLAESLEALDARIGQIRSSEAQRIWLARHIRQQVAPVPNALESARGTPRLVREGSGAEAPPKLLTIEAYILARRVHALPEPQRTALALFYLDLFSISQISDIVGTPVEDLGAVLSSARSILQETLRPSDAPAHLPV